MPIYEYYCDQGHEFEIIQRIEDPVLQTCKLCDGQAHRKISPSHGWKRAGVYLFDRRYGARDILHDKTLSQREKQRSLSRP
ncbi:MAG: zinc ribbon domain-containing protein [Candidatus Tectomicrobia bacterium]|uniref:Zinc ribbon domain-containing protein n=1 Tax=Tectimicrobiota bacterium TaxID=2528274 RepID=A0A932FUQ2_UNCTE|nr:zinc ribbon domain-containing protein [Candidatus Tectomicrobia bacterium]